MDVSGAGPPTARMSGEEAGCRSALCKERSGNKVDGTQGRCGVHAAGYCSGHGERRATWTRVAQSGKS